MSYDGTGPGLAGQELVYAAWRLTLRGRDFALRSDLDLSRMIGELAHVSVLAREDAGFRFRIAGSGLYQAFALEARGRLISEIPSCAGQPAWSEGLTRALREGRPVLGRSRTPSGKIHFWMRLPLSSDGVTPDQVLAHDRILPLEALVDPDRAARLADRAMRLDAEELQPAKLSQPPSMMMVVILRRHRVVLAALRALHGVEGFAVEDIHVADAVQQSRLA
jgi:hypothetical protein